MLTPPTWIVAPVGTAATETEVAPGAVNPFASFTVNWDGEAFDFAGIVNQ